MHFHKLYCAVYFVIDVFSCIQALHIFPCRVHLHNCSKQRSTTKTSSPPSPTDNLKIYLSLSEPRDLGPRTSFWKPVSGLKTHIIQCNLQDLHHSKPAFLGRFLSSTCTAWSLPCWDCPAEHSRCGRYTVWPLKKKAMFSQKTVFPTILPLPYCLPPWHTSRRSL